MSIGKIKRETLENAATMIREKLAGSDEANEGILPSQIAMKIDHVATHNYERGYRNGENSIIPIKRQLEAKVFGEVRDGALADSVGQAVSDFEAIRGEIIAKGVTLGAGRPTEEYADKVGEVYTKGESAGYERGNADGAAEGYENGKAAGRAEGYNEGFSTGKSEGYNSGYQIGKVDGKAEGYADRTAENNQLARDFSGAVYGEQKNETIENVVNTAINDIGDTKVALEERGVDTNQMPTSALPDKIDEVYEKGKTIGNMQGRNEYAEELIEYNHNLQQAVYGIPTGREIEEVTEQAATDLNAIKGKIEEKGVDIPFLTPSSVYPAKIDDVYNKGYEQGKSEGDYEEAFNEGKAEAYEEIQDLNAELEQALYGTDTGGKSYYDEVWDDVQENGNRINYRYGFSGNSWNDKTFKPKYNIVPSAYNGIYAFTNCRITNLKQILLDCGVTIDTSQVINALEMFGNSEYLTHLPRLDFGACTIFTTTFTECKSLVSIDGLKVNDKTRFSSSFNNCDALEEIRFEGIIGQNGLNLQWSTKLSKNSITSIINALSTTTSGLSITLSKVAVNKAFETSTGLADGSTSTDWNNLIGTKTNWTINLV